MNSNQTFPRLCRVLEIYEADFGCEERPDGQETMVCVRLLDTTENANLSEHPEYTIRTADQALYDAGIDEGDRVWFDPESGKIEKALKYKEVTKEYQNGTILL